MKISEVTKYLKDQCSQILKPWICWFFWGEFQDRSSIKAFVIQSALFIIQTNKSK